jgi:predicted outer membrane repeat protein
MRRSALVASLCVALAFACAAGGKIIYVDDDAPPGGDGHSWQTAYRYLQDALQEGQPLPSEPPPVNPSTKKGGVRSLRVRSVSAPAIASDSNEPIEIRVAQGVYRPDQAIRPKAGDRLATFQLTSGLALKGGYAGVGMADPNARDRKLYETILSGDLAGNDVEVSDPCDLWRESSRSENAYHVVTASGTDPNTLLEGFTITAANAYEYNYHPQAPNTHNSGGGLRNDGGSLWVRDCTLVRNVAEAYGGAMFNEDGASPHVADCEFLENAGRGGGGVYNRNSHAVFENCVVRANWALSQGAGIINDTSTVDCRECSFLENEGRLASVVSHVWSSKGRLVQCRFIGNHGPGLIVGDKCQMTVQGCVFQDNQADEGRGGAIFTDSAGGMAVVGCSFNQNTATSGGALYFAQSPYPLNTDVMAVQVLNCIFNGNSAKDGGAISSLLSRVNVVNCTFSRNYADRGSAVLSYHGAYLIPGYTEISNCILWDDRDNEIATLDDSPISVTYCNVSGGWSHVYDPRAVVVWGDGNMEVAPVFADPSNHDYHLKSQAGRYDTGAEVWVMDDVTSPCIDAGNPMSPVGLEPFPSGGRVNMGAHGGTVEASKSYFGTTPCQTVIAGDINGDCRVDLTDLAILARHWLETD